MSPNRQFYLLITVLFGAGFVWLATHKSSDARRHVDTSISSALWRLGNDQSVLTNHNSRDFKAYNPAAIRRWDWKRFFPQAIPASDVFVTNEFIPIESTRLVCVAVSWGGIKALRGDGQVVEITRQMLAAETASGRMSPLEQFSGESAW